MDLLSYLIPQLVTRTTSSYNKLIEIVSWRGQLMLYVNGIQQSGDYTTKLWNLGLVPLKHQKHNRVKRILVLGVGGATAFPMLRAIYPNAHITGVDIDSEIIQISKAYFGMGHLSQVQLVCQDARMFCAEAKKKHKTYDLVVIDLYIGNDVPAFVTSESFLSSVRDVLSPIGKMVLNYFIDHDQPQHAKRLFDTLRAIYPSYKKIDVLRNVFFYCDKIRHNV